MLKAIKVINAAVKPIALWSFLIGTSLLTSCKSNRLYDAPKVSTFRGNRLPAPPGMVYIPSGTIFYKSSQDSSDVGKNVSLSAFFIDETEVTNKQYRQFVNWVADSIAVVDYLEDDQYFLEQAADDSNDVKGERLIDWSVVKKNSPLWQNKNPEIQEKLRPLMTMKGGKRVLNQELLIYRFSYLKMDGINNNQYVTDTVHVMPVDNIWSKDFPNAQMTAMDANYFDHQSFDYNPVVGVSWKQARAYADWRGKEIMASLQKNSYLKGYQLTFSLPTEAQWQYAAEGKLDPTDTIRRTRLTIKDRKSDKKKLAVNFKQGEGTYSRDGSTFTVPVKAYTPNAFGVYNMAGNVSEWTLDAFSPSAVEFVNDLNPVLLYDADDNASYALKRKVVRGGSWKDNGGMLDSDTRNYEQQDEAHSYIGFRCVMSAFEMTTPQVKTRKYKN
ncbi:MULTISPECIES: T9SS ring complex lipoprotein PorK/GldK [Olivibacter]|uniref:SUMF1/EgtB/PvdO family nonheme iron enzyme n=1 Tax=Olivibacter jilunii TaxID=985016 RepID=A0ABW6B841_9SPHI|nr:SUMF1/EgtB/PvdO family nonheme iron enzyme [Olivibacter sp. UJ_SKK_5.1]MDX3912849.1 SUMF1/EgtB/PvdO family nonheme iron enzyme [Pseudosphingobacterium sp.]